MGVVAASITGFNLLRKIVDIGLAQIIADLMRVYQDWVHIPIGWLFAWLRWPEPPAWVIDLGLLWLLIGGIVLRSTWGLRTASLRSRLLIGTHSEFWKLLMTRRAAMPLFLAVCILAWPVAAWYLIRSPYIHTDRDNDLWHIGYRTSGGTYQQVFLYDMRVVLTAQALAALACIGAWVAVNVLLNLYA